MRISSRASAPTAVTVTAPARLHMGFLDLGGSLGRMFGSIGVALNEIATRVRLSPAERLVARGPCSDRCLDAARRIADAFGLPPTAEIVIEESIPQHVGLGSGTQLALAVGVGLHRLHGSGRSVRDIARVIERGNRSGIGIAVFEQGGFLVDGGRGPDTATPPLLSRFEFPDDWRLILVFDDRGQGLHGDRERQAFRNLPRFPATDAARLCHLLLLQGLPAIAEHELGAFGAVISEIQRTVGEHFAPAQGGRFTSPDVREAMDWLETCGAVGIGQTSWGPTGFCIVQGSSEASRLTDEARTRFSGREHLSFLSASARNCGAAIQVGNLREAIPAESFDAGAVAAHKPCREPSAMSAVGVG